jgi:hypothetical protein
LRSSSETRDNNVDIKDGNCTYLNQFDARNLLVVSVLQLCEDRVLYIPWHFQTTAKMQYFQMHFLA